MKWDEFVKWMWTVWVAVGAVERQGLFLTTTERGSAEMVRRDGVSRRDDDGTWKRVDGQSLFDWPDGNKMNGRAGDRVPLGQIDTQVGAPWATKEQWLRLPTTHWNLTGRIVFT